MAAETGGIAVLFPVVVGSGLQEVFGEGVEVGAGQVFGKVFFVEDGFGAGDIGKEAAGGEAIGAESGLAGADDVGEVEAVGFVEGFAEEEAGNVEADVAEVGGGGEAALGELVDVEGKLGLDVGVGILGVVDRGTEALFEAGELDGDGKVDGGAVADGVADVMGEGADGEGEFVGGLGVAQKREDEVAGADVVGEVGEELVAEGVVAEVLDSTATVGVAVGLLDLRLGEMGEALEQDGADGGFPGEVDELFVGLDGVGDRRRGREQESQQGEGLKDGRAASNANDLASWVPAGMLAGSVRMSLLYLSSAAEERVRLAEGVHQWWDGGASGCGMGLARRRSQWWPGRGITGRDSQAGLQRRGSGGICRNW